MKPRTIDNVPLPVAMWHISQRGYALIKEFETLSLVSYDDGFGNPTIGWGHKNDKDGLSRITEGQAEALLKLDALKALSVIRQSVTGPLWGCEVDALACLVFNIGGENFVTSHLLKAINEKDAEAVKREWLRWNHVDGKVVRGLTRRRKAELAMWCEVPF